MTRRRLWVWLRRYAPAEVAATGGALLGALLGARLAGAPGGAIGGTICESVAFYGFVFARDVLTEQSTARGRSPRQVVVGLITEFGPAEALDTLLVRPAAMYTGPLLTGDLLTGTLAGKIVADLVFYGLSAIGYERRRRRRAVVAGDPFAPVALDAVAGRTALLLIDLDRVVGAYHRLAAALPVDALHFAVKCQPDRRVLTVAAPGGLPVRGRLLRRATRGPPGRGGRRGRVVLQPSQTGRAHRPARTRPAAGASPRTAGRSCSSWPSTHQARRCTCGCASPRKRPAKSRLREVRGHPRAGFPPAADRGRPRAAALRHHLPRRVSDDQPGALGIGAGAGGAADHPAGAVGHPPGDA
jgi:hypothetical protein